MPRPPASTHTHQGFLSLCKSSTPAPQPRGPTDQSPFPFRSHHFSLPPLTPVQPHWLPVHQACWTPFPPLCSALAVPQPGMLSPDIHRALPATSDTHTNPTYSESCSNDPMESCPSAHPELPACFALLYRILQFLPLSVLLNNVLFIIHGFGTSLSRELNINPSGAGIYV